MANIVTTKTGSRVQVLQYQIMPDHFHGILYVRDPLPKGWHLARMIAAWKGDCSREYWRNSGLTPRAQDKEKKDKFRIRTLVYAEPADNHLLISTKSSNFALDFDRVHFLYAKENRKHGNIGIVEAGIQGILQPMEIEGKSGYRLSNNATF